MTRRDACHRYQVHRIGRNIRFSQACHSRSAEQTDCTHLLLMGGLLPFKSTGRIRYRRACCLFLPPHGHAVCNAPNRAALIRRRGTRNWNIGDVLPPLTVFPSVPCVRTPAVFRCQVFVRHFCSFHFRTRFVSVVIIPPSLHSAWNVSAFVFAFPSRHFRTTPLSWVPPQRFRRLPLVEPFDLSCDACFPWVCSGIRLERSRDDHMGLLWALGTVKHLGLPQPPFVRVLLQLLSMIPPLFVSPRHGTQT